jgi:hypothetical protein
MSYLNSALLSAIINAYVCLVVQLASFVFNYDRYKGHGVLTTHMYCGIISELRI